MKLVKILVVAGMLAGTVMLPVSAATAASHPTVPSATSIGALLATLHDPGASTADQFGVNVAVSGRVAVVGSYGTPNGGHSAVGTAYIYTKGSTGWHKQPKAILQDPNGALGDLFGISVAVYGNTVVVGASGANTNSGAVYIYTRGTSGWPTTPTVTLPAPAGGNFGKSVAISDNTIVVGANNSNGGDGAAYIYTEGVSGWPTTPTVTLPVPAAAQGGNFGYWTAISGSTVVVGALTANSESGAAFIYTEGTNGWPTTPAATLLDPAATPGDRFGYSVAVSGATVVVGTNTGYGTGAGTAYIYVRTKTGWPTAPKVTLNDPAATSGDLFGLSVAVSGTTIVVGAPGTNSGAGQAYAYAKGTTGWPTAPSATLPHPAQDVTYGYSVAVRGTTASAGEPNGSPGGAAYIYQV